MLSQWLDFIEKVIGHIAWPLALIVGLFVFRRPLVDLSRALQKVRYGAAELDFTKEVSDFVEEARESGVEPEVISSRPLLPDDFRLAILSAWNEIERILGKWFESHMIDLVVSKRTAEQEDRGFFTYPSSTSQS